MAFLSFYDKSQSSLSEGVWCTVCTQVWGGSEGKPCRNPLGIQLMILEKLILYSIGQKQQVLVAKSVSVPQLGTNLFCTLLFYISTHKIMLLHVITFQKHSNLKGKQKKVLLWPDVFVCMCVYIILLWNDYLCLYYICTFPLHRYCGSSKNTRFCHVEKTVNMSFSLIISENSS